LNSVRIDGDYFFTKKVLPMNTIIFIRTYTYYGGHEAVLDKESIIRLLDVLHVLYYSGSRPYYRR